MGLLIKPILLAETKEAAEMLPKEYKEFQDIFTDSSNITETADIGKIY